MAYDTPAGQRYLAAKLKKETPIYTPNSPNTVKPGGSIPTPPQSSAPSPTTAVATRSAVPTPPRITNPVVKNSVSSIGVPKASSVPTPPDPNVYGNNGVGSITQRQSSQDLLKSGNLDAINAEIERATGIRTNRVGSGMNTSQQDDWLNKLNAAKAAIPKPATVPTPPMAAATPAPSYGSNMAYNVGTNADREAEAQRQVAAALAEKNRIASQQKQSLATTYGNQLQDIQQNRTLENVAQARVANPFSGKTAWNQGVQNMERSEADSQLANQYNSNMANVDQALADYQNASAEERQRIVDELTRADREFGLSQGQLTGNYAGGRTLAGSAQDWGQQMDLADRTGVLNGQSTLAGKQANLNAALAVSDLTGKVVAPSDNWGQLYDRANSSTTPTYQASQDAIQNNQWNQQFNYQVSRDKIADKQWQQQFAEQARQYGSDYALRRLAQENNISMDNAQLELQRAGFDLDILKYGNSTGNTASNGPSAGDISMNINRAITGLGGSFDISTPAGKQQVERMIVTQTTDPVTAVQLYNMYGITVPSDLQSEYNAALKKANP